MEESETEIRAQNVRVYAENKKLSADLVNIELHLYEVESRLELERAQFKERMGRVLQENRELKERLGLSTDL